MKKVILAIAVVLSVSGCASNEMGGTIVGGALGGLLGNQVGGGSGKVAATIVGTMIGGYLGGNIGRTMDAVDRQQQAYALENVRTNRTYEWNNPDTGAHYETTPTKTYSHQREGYCREYRTTAYIGGKKENIYGNACRQPDGSWKVQ